MFIRRVRVNVWLRAIAMLVGWFLVIVGDWCAGCVMF